MFQLAAQFRLEEPYWSNALPAYDLVSTALVFPEEKADLALTLNAKKRRTKNLISLLLPVHSKWKESSKKISLERWRSAQLSDWNK